MGALAAFRLSRKSRDNRLRLREKRISVLRQYRRESRQRRRPPRYDRQIFRLRRQIRRGLHNPCMIENSWLYSYLYKVLAGIFDLIPLGLLGRVWAVKCTDYAAAFEATEARLRSDRRDRAGARGGGGASMLDCEERRDGRRSQRQSRQPAAESVAPAPGDPERGDDCQRRQDQFGQQQVHGKLEGSWGARWKARKP